MLARTMPTLLLTYDVTLTTTLAVFRTLTLAGVGDYALPLLLFKVVRYWYTTLLLLVIGGEFERCC